MRNTALLLALTFFSPLVFADDKKSGNNLRVKINHEWEDTKSGKKSGKTYRFQFKYDTEEWLFITDRPESSTGVYLRRDEVGKFKAIVEKMLKFADAVYTNQITGVKKEFKGEKEILNKIYGSGTYVNISEDVKKPFSKNAIKFRILAGEGGGSTRWYLGWNYTQLEELAKIFDEKQKEVFKKYDLLKALND
jgi:hypothetical protein